MHRLDPTRQMAIGHDPRQCPQFGGFVGAIQGPIGVVPVTNHTQTFEIRTLKVDLGAGIFTAFVTKLDRIQLHPDLAVFFLHGQFDGQTMAIPTRHIRRIKARQRARLDGNILEYLVDRMAQVNRTIGVGRTIVQHVTGTTGTLPAQAALDIQLVPALQRRWLALGQVAAHGKIGGGQVDGGFVIAAHGCS